MKLPDLARALLAKRTDGAPIAHEGMAVLTDPSFNPSTEQQVVLTPAANRYALIVYDVDYGLTPWEAFSVDMEWQGDFLFTGRLTERDAVNGHQLWAVVRTNAPLNFTVTNNHTVYFLPFWARLSYLVINTRDDFDAAQRVIAAWQTGQMAAPV